MSKKHLKKSAKDLTSLPPEEADRLRSILEDPSPLDPASVADRIRTEAVALAFIEKIPLETPRILEIVQAVQQAFPRKDIQKAAKKTLFRLKQRGVEVDRKGEEGPSVFTVAQPEELPEPSAYVSPPDGAGTRAVLLMIPRAPAGVDMGMGIVSDKKGLMEFVFGRYSRKKGREMREVFSQAIPHLIETTMAHAATILESCYRGGESGPKAAGEYLEIRPWLLQNVSLLDNPPVYDLFPQGPPFEQPTHTQLDRLLSHEWMASWILEPEPLKPLLEEFQNAEESPILISAEQKAARKEELREKFIGRYYTGERKKLLKARLEEIAYLFQKGGDEEYARSALGVASSLEEGGTGFQPNSFLGHLVDRTLALVGGVKRSQPQPAVEERPSGLILPK